MNLESMRARVSLIVAGLLVTGLPACAPKTPRPPDFTAQSIKARTGHEIRALDARPTGDLPPGVTLDDGVTEDEAVAVALWNNAQLSVDLAGLGVARANLLEAGLLRNPTLQVLFPVGLKPFELALSWPVESLVQRPKRVAAAQRDWERVAEALVQHGLNTARDARLAHSALVRAQERMRLTTESEKLRKELVDLTAARLRAGDASELELRSAEADAALAADMAARSLHDVAIARERLRFQMGLAPAGGAGLRGEGPAIERRDVPPADGLREAAWTSRPDLRALELAVAAAAQRAKWERSRWLVLAAILSSKEVGTSGVLSGPGVSGELPIFGAHRGGVARADAEVEVASRQYLALRQRVDLEVSEAREVLAQAEESLADHTTRVLPRLEEAAAGADRAFATGDVSYLFIVGVARQVVDARLRLADLQADVRTARAELDRSVGTRTETLKRP